MLLCFKKFSFDFSIYGVFLLQHKIQIQKFLYFSPPSMLKVRKNSFTWASSFAEVFGFRAQMLRVHSFLFA